MLKILIISKRFDTHASAVTWGIGKLGHEVVVWSWTDFPKQDLASLEIGRDGQAQVTLTVAGQAVSSPFDVIWVRRKYPPTPMEGGHPDDAAVVVAESQAYLDNILPLLGHAETRWVNEPAADHFARKKMNQLVAAAAVGLAIPDTLVSNDVAAVRAFLEKHEGRIIHKVFEVPSWENADGSQTFAKTSALSAVHLENEYAVRACPAIYQPQIPKRHELRVTVIGRHAIAAAIYSQQDGDTVDWRYEGGRGKSNLRSIDLAPELEKQCLDVCRKLGIAFGCVDLIVSKDNQVVFLEVNNVGQFLFKEVADPGMQMLDAFCRYLVYGDAAPAGAPLLLADYQASPEYEALNVAYREMMRLKRMDQRKAA